jgi:hypothetical protein
MACKLATAKTKSPKEKTTKPVKQKEGILSRDKYKPGDLISSDQFVVMTPGRLLTGYGREAPHNSFHGGTIYQDAASNLVRVQNQVTLGAAETVVGKANFEEWIWNLAGVLASEYHSDNGIFSSEQFRNDCINKRQKQSFSGVGAKHQNARAERTIQTISYWARHMMVHAAIHWPSDGANNIRLWAFAVNHAAWLYNRLPNRNLGWKSPLELFTESIDDHRDLRRVHVWGCPTFVLEAKLQDGQRIPKFNRRGRMGQFLGFSDQHSSTVGLVRNLATNFVSPQFHVVFDDLFTSIYNNVRMDDSKLENLFTKLFETCHEWYGEDSEITGGGNEGIPLEISDQWLTEPEKREKQGRIEIERKRRVKAQREIDEEFERLNKEFTPPDPFASEEPPDRAVVSDDDSSDDSDLEDDPGVTTPEGDPPPREPMGVSPGTPPHASPRAPSSVKPPRRSRRVRRGDYDPTTEGLERHSDFQRVNQSLVTERMRDSTYMNDHRDKFTCSFEGRKQTPGQVRRSRKKRAYKARLFRRKLSEANQTFGSTEWEVPTVDSLIKSDFAQFVHFAASDAGFDGTVDSLVANWLHPLMLQAKSKSNSEDNPDWLKAMNGPFAEEYWEAACIEIETLEKIDAWDVVERTPEMNVLPSTWAFKCKRYPDGLIKKFKARFCARGDRQIEGVDFFETYAPVVQWTTVRLMLILECLLDLTSKQGDVTCALFYMRSYQMMKWYTSLCRGALLSLIVRVVPRFSD